MRMFPFLLVLFLVISIPLDVVDGCESDYVRLSAVIPTSQSEGVGITNYGNGDVNLKEYRLSDGEGTITFTKSIILSGRSTIFLLKSAPEPWMMIDDYIQYGDKGVVCKGFLLRDTGDDVYLYKGEQLIDTFVYGDESNRNGWDGDAFQKIPKKCYAKRTSIIDTDTSKDWEIFTPGRSDFSMTGGYECEITPFVFPDSKGIPVKDVVYGTTSRIDISTYLLSEPGVISSLLHALSDGVIVRILLEGSPAGGIPLSERIAMSTLVYHGADVRFIISDDGYKRYNFLHSKYAVIDEDITIITSENWAESSFNNNRGWGAVISSNEYAHYMRSVFESDFNGNLDIRSFKELFPKERRGTFEGYIPSNESFPSYHGRATPILSPDFSFSAMKGFITSANERLFVEQLEVEYDWLDEGNNPLSWMIGSKADCRLLIDTTFDSEFDSDEKDGFGIRDRLKGSDTIAVRTSAMDRMLHNKGIISDDGVWIGSINWSSTSIHDNREVAVIIESKEVSDFFAKYFIDDWGTESADDIVITVDIIGELKNGRTIVIDASGSYAPNGSLFEWDIDGDGVIERTGRKISIDLSDSTYDITLRVTDGDETYLWKRTLDISDADMDVFPIPLKYIPIIIICIATATVSLLHRWKCK